jgi:uncharacterized membrane-anchored protein YitT (DUF2179 family)
MKNFLNIHKGGGHVVLNQAICNNYNYSHWLFTFVLMFCNIPLLALFIYFIRKGRLIVKLRLSTWVSTPNNFEQITNSNEIWYEIMLLEVTPRSHD